MSALSPLAVNDVALADVLARGDIWRGDALARLPGQCIPSGHPELDEELPGGGWPCGNLTEFLVDRSGIGELTLLLPALARLAADGGWLALVAPPWLPHAPAGAAAGIAPERLLVVRACKEAAWSIEALLASGGFAGVLAWPGSALDAKALRRLQVAAEGRPVFAALWRAASAAVAPSPAPLRISLGPDTEARTRGQLALRILKRRGRPASRPLSLDLARSGSRQRALAGPALSLLAAGSAAAAAVA